MISLSRSIQVKDAMYKKKFPRDVLANIQSLFLIFSDLGKVKLKSVERSPNGTPLRPPPNPATPVDAASLIAAALKKRFNANYR